MSGSQERLWLTVRTARLLSAAQIGHRVRLRSQRALLGCVGPAVEAHLRRPTGPLPGWPSGFRPLAAQLADGMPSPEANAEGRFQFLNHGRVLGRPVGWNPAGVDRLWRFHLHYFEWAWAFAAHRDRAWSRDAFGELWKSWRASAPLGAGDAWAPYVVALRSWVLCGVFDSLISGGADEQAVVDDLARHAWFLRHHLERDVGGNHLLKDCKALIGLGVFLGDARLTDRGGRELQRQVMRQILADGGHYERSPSYHCQVLEDLLDVRGLLAASGDEKCRELDEPIRRMQVWLGTVLLPDGDVPMLNDCALVGRDRLSRLESHSPAPGRVALLADSGYVVLRPGPCLHLVVDVGIACPPRLPAHAHADCLSFELAIDGERVIVDSGTSTYTAGPTRDYERSTAAHNTVEIDGQSQIEVWGAFRVGRRAQPTLEWLTDDGARVDLRASHDGYQRLTGGPIHHRRFQVARDTITITDDIEGTGHHRAVARIHLRPGMAQPKRDPEGGGWRAGPLWLSFCPAEATVTDGPVSWSFGQTESGTCLETAIQGHLPLQMITTLRIDSGEPAQV